MIKKIISWFCGIFFGGATIFYVVCKIIAKENAFTNLVDSIGTFIASVFIWVAHHIVAILIVIAIAVALWFVYFLIKKHKEKDL